MIRSRRSLLERAVHRFRRASLCLLGLRGRRPSPCRDVPGTTSRESARPSPVSPWCSGLTPVSARALQASSMGRTWWCPTAGRTPHTTALDSLTCRPGEARQTRWSRQRVRGRRAVAGPPGSRRRRRVRQQPPASRSHARVRPLTPSIPSPGHAVDSSPVRGGFGSTGGQVDTPS